MRYVLACAAALALLAAAAPPAVAQGSPCSPGEDPAYTGCTPTAGLRLLSFPGLRIDSRGRVVISARDLLRRRVQIAVNCPFPCTAGLLVGARTVDVRRLSRRRSRSSQASAVLLASATGQRAAPGRLILRPLLSRRGRRSVRLLGRRGRPRSLSATIGAIVAFPRGATAAEARRAVIRVPRPRRRSRRR